MRGTAGMRFVHLTDPHLSSLAAHRLWTVRGKRRLGYLSWTRRRQHHHRGEVLEAVTEQALALGADAFAVTGDLVQLGLADEHAQARAWLERLEGVAPVLLVPGNHDVYQADAVPSMYHAWGRFLGTDEHASQAFPVVRDVGEVRFLGVSSAVPEPFWSAGGAIGQQQLARLSRVLGESSARFHCVLLHHPPLAHVCPRRKALRDADALSALLARHRVPLVLHGHIHRNREYPLGEHGRVYATASASNADAYARASLRVFDVDPGADHWQVRCRLLSLAADGAGLTLVEEHDWSWPGLPQVA